MELEESAAKLPSLQTALDNAYKYVSLKIWSYLLEHTYKCVTKHLIFREITELNKVNAAKSTEVQVS